MASGPNTRANHAAVDRAVALLESLAPRLCLIQRSVDAGVELIAVVETAHRLEHEATKASLLTASADAQGSHPGGGKRDRLLWHSRKKEPSESSARRAGSARPPT
jgi:hypothetical protein